jgi:CHAT domain-containing protein
MSEIFNLRSNADLLVLSACETARRKLSRGEGIVGLSSAFLFAGSRSVVASFWNVNGVSTSLFMECFYRGLKSRLSKPDALRHARLETTRKRIKRAVTGEQGIASISILLGAFRTGRRMELSAPFSASVAKLEAIMPQTSAETA